MPDAVEQVEGVDEQLWIRISSCDSHDYLIGNCHTFPGRMSAYCPTDGIHYCVSMSEIEEMSPEAQRWVDGYLAGNEPRPEGMFGPGIRDAHDSDPRWLRWTEAVAEFRRTGAWPHADWAHLIPFPPGTALPSFVWAHRGDEVWRWSGDAWIQAPQPLLKSGTLESTACFERGHCNVTMVTTVHGICDDCGEVDQCVPEGFTLEEWERAQYGYQATPL